MTSRFLRSNSQPRDTIGDSFNGGTSARGCLPTGSEILFREPTVWDRYSWQIALIAAVVLVQAGLIVLLLQERRRRQFAEVQARQRMAELAHVNRFFIPVAN